MSKLNADSSQVQMQESNSIIHVLLTGLSSQHTINHGNDQPSSEVSYAHSGLENQHH